jgi:hypothetical protein
MAARGAALQLGQGVPAIEDRRSESVFIFTAGWRVLRRVTGDAALLLVTDEADRDAPADRIGKLKCIPARGH